MIEWRAVIAYEGLYEVSNVGDVRSLPRRVATGYGTRIMGGTILAASPRKGDGRRAVSLHRDGRGTPALVAPLVLGAFVGPRPEGLHACHTNGIVTDDRVENLRWDTPSGNMHDRVRHGRHWATARTHCPREHVLAAPNLVANHRGRTCLACARAAAYCWRWERKGVPQDRQAVADRYYDEIMGVAA